jgi:hypothetical protein
MGFFDRFEPAPEPRFAPSPPKPAWMKPDDEFPIPLAYSNVMARHEKAAVAITGLRVFTFGFEFQLAQFHRRSDPPDNDPFDIRHRRPTASAGLAASA